MIMLDKVLGELNTFPISCPHNLCCTPRAAPVGVSRAADGGRGSHPGPRPGPRHPGCRGRAGGAGGQQAEAGRAGGSVRCLSLLRSTYIFSKTIDRDIFCHLFGHYNLGFAGVFYEKLLKKGAQPSVVIRKICLTFIFCPLKSMSTNKLQNDCNGNVRNNLLEISSLGYSPCSSLGWAWATQRRRYLTRGCCTDTPMLSYVCSFCNQVTKNK